MIIQSLAIALIFATVTGQTPKKEDPPEGDEQQHEEETSEKPSVLTPPPGEIPDEERKQTPPGEVEKPDHGEELTPQSEDFFQFTDFVDNRVTFAISNVNIFAGPGDRTTPTSGYRIGVDRNLNLFLENVNTRFTGYETLSHLVLYKKLPAFWVNWETEVALAALVLADTDTGRISLFDSGTYLRLIRKFDDGKEEKVGSIDLTAWPVSSDRFRLGYTYLISWGGTAIFPGKLQSSSITEGAVPGARIRWRAPNGEQYAYLGFKSALLLSRQVGKKSGEQVPNYGVLAGAGTDIGGTAFAEVNGGYFQKGVQERPGLEGQRIQAIGISARATIYQGQSRAQSSDLRLYRNDPTDPVDYLSYQDYKPGIGFAISAEGTFLSQNLEDPDQFGSEKLVPALAAGLVGTAKIDELTLRLDAFFQSANFILFNVPGFVPFQATPTGSTTTPEFFLAGTLGYVVDELKLSPSISVGVKVPATYHGEVLDAQGQMLGGANPGEVRTQVIVDETNRIVLPPGKGAVPIIGAVVKVPLAISRSTAVAFEARFELNDNQPRLVRDSELRHTVYEFDDPYRLALGLVLQSRW